MRWPSWLLLMAALYVSATALEPRHAAWGYIASFADAGMFGAIADCFAVVALFRHPLALPLPPTPITPANTPPTADTLAPLLLSLIPI